MGSRQHVLLELAVTKELPEVDLTPPGGVYDFEVGGWIVPATGQMLVSLPGRARPSTKKRDVETGEDQKGE